MIKVAINGFGRIGRLAYRMMIEDKDFEVVCINDLGEKEELAYLLKYDTTHRTIDNKNIKVDGDYLVYDDKKTLITSFTNPEELPWANLAVDVVLECTGHFTDKEKASLHLKAGAKKVIISAPAKGDIKTIVYNVNHNTLTKEDNIISAASCTTNGLAPVVDLLDKEYGIIKGYMTTVHAYTNDQSTQDASHKKGYLSRRGRAAAENIIPASTGAAKAIGLVCKNLDKKLSGIALRVPVVDGSVIDLTLELNKNVTKEEVNNLFKNNTNETINYTEDPIVSSDVIGMKYATLVDGLSTDILEVDGKQLLKIITWYDNETSFTAQMLRTTKYLMK
jgi:glyceraldehyde-3-phosphate dehydrogenase, type I